MGTLLGLAAACPNACSGNGICGTQDKCSCYQNWQGPDCSQRTCTFTLAWADTADGTNQAHYYAECGNKGVCDRKSGECKCFDGYEGKGCRRSTCPEGCSGHGTCEYIEELATSSTVVTAPATSTRTSPARPSWIPTPALAPVVAAASPTPPPPTWSLAPPTPTPTTATSISFGTPVRSRAASATLATTVLTAPPATFPAVTTLSPPSRLRP